MSGSKMKAAEKKQLTQIINMSFIKKLARKGMNNEK
jgi:hypothetical protein